MSESEPVANFRGLHGFKTVVYDSALVPEDIWVEAQKVHRESLLSRLPSDQSDRADVLVGWGDFNKYKGTRVDPNLLVGNGWNDDQLFRRTKFAAIYDRSSQLVGGVLTADNSSADFLPKPLRPVEYWAKMLIKPGVPLPKVGNRRYFHLREAYTRPDVQPELAVDEDTLVVSGIALAGIFYSVKEANERQRMVAYEVPTDPADSELTAITAILGMSTAGYNRSHTLPGYTDELVRVQAPIRNVVSRILEMSGAKPALDGIKNYRLSLL